MKIICIIPAYNEERNISQVIDSVKAFVDEIIVVDDGSNDHTADIAKSKQVVLLQHIINRGQGAALQTGNEYALQKGAGIIVHFDADGQFRAEDIKKVVDLLVDGKLDIVLGSRMMQDNNLPMFKKNIIFPLAHLINFIFFNARLTDPQSGFRAMTSQAARKLQIENDGMAHCSEIIGKIFKNNLRFKEVPIQVDYREFGQGFGGGLKVVKDLLLNKIVH